MSPQPDVTSRPGADLYVRTALKSWDFGVGVGCAMVAAVLALDDGVRGQGVTVALASCAVGMAVLGVVLAALAIITAFFDGHYRRVLESAGGIRRAMAPYLLVAGTGGLAAVVGLLTALAWPAFGEWTQIVALAVTVLLTVWSVAGTVSLVEITLFHAEQRAALMRGFEEAADVRAQRLRRAGSPQ